MKISGYMYKFQDLTPISGHFRTNFKISGQRPGLYMTTDTSLHYYLPPICKYLSGHLTINQLTWHRVKLQSPSLNYLQAIPLVLKFMYFIGYVIASKVSFLHHLFTLSTDCSNAWFVTSKFSKQSLVLFHQILHSNQVTTCRHTKHFMYCVFLNTHAQQNELLNVYRLSADCCRVRNKCSSTNNTSR